MTSDHERHENALFDVVIENDNAGKDSSAWQYKFLEFTAYMTSLKVVLKAYIERILVSTHSCDEILTVHVVHLF